MINRDRTEEKGGNMLFPFGVIVFAFPFPGLTKPTLPFQKQPDIRSGSTLSART